MPHLRNRKKGRCDARINYKIQYFLFDPDYIGKYKQIKEIDKKENNDEMNTMHKLVNSISGF